MSDELQQSGQIRGGPLNINTASIEALIAVNGLGPSLAQRVVTFREEHGPFRSVDELVQVSGIGPRLLERLRDQITVEPLQELTRGGGDEEELPAGVTRERPDAVVPWIERLPPAAEPSVEPAHEWGPKAEDLPPPGETEEIEREPAEVPAEAVPAAEAAPFEEGPVAIAEATLTVADVGEEVSGEPEQPAEALAVEQEEMEGEAMVAETKGVEAAAPEQAQPAAQRAREERAQEAPPVGARVEFVERRPSVWRGILLVLLGGIAGVLLTLLVAVIWSGTVNFAPRAEVDALSRNLNTVYNNQELAWQRIDQLVTRANDLEREVSRLQTLRDRVGQLEGDLQTARADVAAARSDLQALQRNVADLEENLTRSVNQLDERVQATEGDIAELHSTLQDVQQSLDNVETRLERFGTFFSALRDLLIDLQGLPEPTPTAQPTPQG
ncbi:MAG: helix-hairpin-helix domain-containing protein [Chloroflexi bacterium]|nr:helix-hairpin-helix domain-containing protein [Chloroflexota bacterium]